MPDTDYELIKGELASGLDTVERLERFAAGEATDDDRDHYGVDLDEWFGLTEILDYAVLEAVTMSERPWGTDDDTVTGVRLLITYGGPNVTATYRVDGAVTVDAYWGASEAHGNATAPSTAFELFDIAEQGVTG